MGEFSSRASRGATSVAPNYAPNSTVAAIASVACPAANSASSSPPPDMTGVDFPRQAYRAPGNGEHRTQRLVLKGWDRQEKGELG